ncbi:MAG: hypothetical protein WBV82_27720 [Myxococcaceae bacterium]
MPVNNLNSNSFNHTKWASFDRQTVETTNGAGKAVVDHGASAKENAKAIGQNVKDAFTLNHFKDLKQSANEAEVLGPALKFAMGPWALAGEVVDVAALPLKVAKNTVDAAAHAIAAAAEKVVDWK